MASARRGWALARARRLHPADAVRAAAGRRPVAPLPRFDPAGPLVVLSPHLDDAVLSTWATLRAEDDVRVLTAFTRLPPPGLRAPPWDRLAGFADARTAMRERLAEDAAVLAGLGVPTGGLGLCDEQYRAPLGEPAPRLAALGAALVAAVPAARGLLLPAAIRGHPDHQLVRGLAGGPAGGLPVELYADLPYAIAYGWPRWVASDPDAGSALDVAATDWEHWWTQGPWPAPERGAPRVLALDPGQQAAKLAALRAYATQYPVLSGGPRDWLAAPGLLGREVRWPVR